MTTITRFAPSPTGFLHLGGARTALFNWLFARNNNGKFFLRIEDTDQSRCKKEYLQSIIDGLAWLNINHDENIIFQSQQIEKHLQIIDILLKNNNAYYCYCPPRENLNFKNQTKTYCSCRNGKPTNNYNISPVVKIKIPKDGEVIINDLVQKQTKIKYENINDFIILRQNKQPTYNLAVVVDDHQMNVSHVIRGVDHLTNTANQILVYNALKWDQPKFAHIPLIHNQQGQKLSKRNGDVNVKDYKNLGILPEAFNNYLLRLGWSHKDLEIIPIEKAIQLFNIKNIGIAAAKFNYSKLLSTNKFYLHNASNERILPELMQIIKQIYNIIPNSEQTIWITKSIESFKTRCSTISQLAEMMLHYIVPIKEYDAITTQPDITINFYNAIKQSPEWSEEKIKEIINQYYEKELWDKKNIFAFLRIAITGKNASPSITHIMHIIGQQETANRIKNFLKSKLDK